MNSEHTFNADAGRKMMEHLRKCQEHKASVIAIGDTKDNQIVIDLVDEDCNLLLFKVITIKDFELLLKTMHHCLERCKAGMGGKPDDPA